MQVNIGEIAEGKVTGLTNFGAFVKLSTGEVGMVHISEVASSYVKDIKEFLTEGQTVKVKVLAVSDAGKISLSIKQAEPKPAENRERPKSPRTDRGERSFSEHKSSGAGRTPPVWQKGKPEEKPQSFEDMMAKFKQTSDERQSGLKKVSDSRRTGYSRKGGNNNRH